MIIKRKLELGLKKRHAATTMTGQEHERRFLPKDPHWHPEGIGQRLSQARFRLGETATGVVQYVMGLPYFHLYSNAKATKAAPDLTLRLSVMDGYKLFQHIERPSLSMMGMTGSLPHGWMARIRSYDDTRYELDIKGPRIGTSRPEFGSYPLSPTKGMALLSKASDPLVKTRYTIPHQGYEWHVDVFDKGAHHRVLCEVEFETGDGSQIPLPSWVGEEITHKKTFSPPPKP